MQVEEIINYFGSLKKASEALKITRQAMYKWLYKGSVPYHQQIKCAAISKGFLKPENINNAELPTTNIDYPIFMFNCPERGLCNVKYIRFSDNLKSSVFYHDPKNSNVYISFDLKNLQIVYEDFTIISNKIHKET